MSLAPFQSVSLVAACPQPATRCYSALAASPIGRAIWPALRRLSHAEREAALRHFAAQALVAAEGARRDAESATLAAAV